MKLDFQGKVVHHCGVMPRNLKVKEAGADGVGDHPTLAPMSREKQMVGPFEEKLEKLVEPTR